MNLILQFRVWFSAGCLLVAMRRESVTRSSAVVYQNVIWTTNLVAWHSKKRSSVGVQQDAQKRRQRPPRSTVGVGAPAPAGILPVPTAEAWAVRPYHQHRLLGWWRCVTRTAGKAPHHIVCFFVWSEGSCACKRRKDPMQSSSDGRWEGRGPFHVPSAAQRAGGSRLHGKAPTCQAQWPMWLPDCLPPSAAAVRSVWCVPEDQVQPNLIHVPWRCDWDVEWDTRAG